jgi:hypothetical protein
MSIIEGSDGQWWELGDRDIGPAVAQLGSRLWDYDSARRYEVETNLKRFGGKTLRGLFYGRDQIFDKRNLRLNMTKAITESLTAKVGKNRPRPTVLTDGGNWSLRRRGKQLQKFLDGSYQQAEIYQKIPLMFRDALLSGTGVMHFFPKFGRMQPGVERVFPLELLVDPVGAVNGDPQELVRVKVIERERLNRMIPGHREEIYDSARVPLDELPQYEDVPNGNPEMVRVWEAWRLADYTNEGELVPGRRVIAVSSGTLLTEEYEDDFFPFEFFHWSPPVRGFWGDSAVGEIRGIEQEVNTLLQSTQKAMRLTGQPWVLTPDTAKVKTDKLTNEAGLIVKYSGMTPPTVVSFQPQHPSVMQQANYLYGKGFEILGTNENQASGTKPPGIDSGRALEQLSEDHLVRFETQARAFEDVVGRSFARQILRVAEKLDEHAKANGKEGYVLRAVANKTTLKIQWADAKLSPDDFFLQTFPTSILPHTPAGRTEEVERWQQNGWINPQQAQQLLDFPDLDSVANVLKADQDLLEGQLEQMLDEGKDITPEPRQNLANALQWGTYSLEKGLTDGTPEEHLEKLRVFLNAIDDMQQQAKAEADAQAALAAQSQPQPGTMPGAGAPPPGAPPAIPGVPAGVPGV